jgi:hypothetical protein
MLEDRSFLNGHGLAQIGLTERFPDKIVACQGSFQTLARRQAAPSNGFD